MNQVILSASLLLCLSIFAHTDRAFASGGGSKSKLDWENSSEILEYHSCGCADSCWIAELKDKKTQKLKLRLRCDCEKVYVFYGSKNSEQIYQNDCRQFECNETNCKSVLIKKEIKSLMQ